MNPGNIFNHHNPDALVLWMFETTSLINVVQRSHPGADETYQGSKQHL